MSHKIAKAARKLLKSMDKTVKMVETNKRAVYHKGEYVYDTSTLKHSKESYKGRLNLLKTQLRG